MNIQQINFKKFSDPILIPQFKKYLVKFEGSSKSEKDQSADKLEFMDDSGKSYVFNSEDVQKGRNSDYYINLHTLRRYYDIKFESDFQRYIPKLSDKEIQSITTKAEDLIKFNGANRKQFRESLQKLLMMKFGNYFGQYNSIPCESKVNGFLNIYPKKGSVDDNENSWSLLNQVPYNPITLKLLVTVYISNYKSFKFSDFLKWIEDNPDILTEELLGRILREIELDDDSQLIRASTLSKIFETSEIYFITCPDDEIKKNMIVVYHNYKPLKIQIIDNRNKSIFFDGSNYRVLVKPDTPMVNHRADYILFRSGMLFANKNVRIGNYKHPIKSRVHPCYIFQDPPLVGEELIVDESIFGVSDV
jgi:hypothetical protein